MPDTHPPSFTTKYRPLLSGAEILTLTSLIQAIPKHQRTPVQATAFKKLSTLVYKIQEDIAAPAYVASVASVASARDQALANHLANQLTNELSSGPALSSSELAIAARLDKVTPSNKAATLTKEQRWADCWHRYASGTCQLNIVECIAALEHCYLNITLPEDIIARTEAMLNDVAEIELQLITTLLAEILELTRLDI